MDDVTARVAQQYETHAYPRPVDDLAAAKASGEGDYGDPSLFGPLFWPEGQPRPDLDILVAGCGTQQASMIAFNNPEARVVGVDLSEASLAHQRYLRDKHGLKNLTLYQGDLREIGSVGRDFDLIVSTGVLHHMPNPSEGLRALRSALRPRGAMMLAVYGAIGRAGVYILQDAFRRMGLDQSAESVAAVRRHLANLHPNHPAAGYIRNAPELAHDTALIDTFLHPQDRAYTVPQILEWMADCGLEHQAWSDNELYYPDALIRTALPGTDAEQWAAVEGLLGLATLHRFVARNKAVSADLADCRPHLKPAVEITETGLRMRGLDLQLSPAHRSLVAQMDGRRIQDGALVGRLWRLGMVMCRQADTQPNDPSSQTQPGPGDGGMNASRFAS